MATERLTIEIDANNRASRALRSLRGQLGGLARAAGAAGAALAGALVTGGVLATREFIKFEDALTGVAKTVDAPAARLRQLASTFRGLSQQIPVSTNELLKIAQLGGQMGIAVDNLDEFAETIAALDVATDLDAESASLALGRFANVMGIARDEIERVGSAIVDLGNNFAVVESEIVQTQQFFAAIAKAAGFTAGEVLGMAAAVQAAGVRSEAGGSAIMRVILEIQKAVEGGTESLETFGEVSQMSAEQFAATFRRDASEAMTAFIGGLSRMQREGRGTTTVLDELGLADVRVTRGLSALASAFDTWVDALKTGETAFRENIALAEEASRFYDRLGADIEKTKNAFVNQMAAVGEQLSPALRDMLGFLRANADFIVGGFAAALATMIDGMRGLIDLVDALINRLNRLPGITLGSADELVEAQQHLDQVNRLLDDISEGAQAGSLLPRAAGILGSDLITEISESDLPITTLEVALKNARRELISAIDDAGGLADQFQRSENFARELDEQMARLADRLRNVSGGGGAPSGGDEGPAPPNIVDAWLTSFGVPTVSELVDGLVRRFGEATERARTRGQGFGGFGGFQAEGAAAERFGGFSGEITGQENLEGFKKFGKKGGDVATDSLSQSMERGGRIALQSLIDGLLRGVDDAGEFLKNIGIQLASLLLTQGLFSALGIASPSSEGRWAGRQLGLGLAMGIEDMMGRVTSAAAGLGRAAIPNVSAPQMRALGATAAAGPVEVGPRFDPSDLQPLSRWAVANDPAFQSLLSAADQIGRQTGRVRER